ncbi:MAG: hypothetical protein AAFQ54_09555 [Pseudomonadota bacterium]
MIRPEARRVLMDWKEILAGGLLIIVGGNWLTTGHTLQPILGGVFALVGAALIAAGWRRVRFPAAEGGPGLVDVTERQITYMTGHGGAALAIDSLARVEVEARPNGHAWIFTGLSGETLRIPGDARGADKLFDALVPLPGINYDQAVQAARAPGSLTGRSDTFLIWQKDRTALH